MTAFTIPPTGTPQDILQAEDRFIITVRREGAALADVRVTARRDGMFRLSNPWKGQALLLRPGEPRRHVGGSVLEIEIKAGETVELIESVED